MQLSKTKNMLEFNNFILEENKNTYGKTFKCMYQQKAIEKRACRDMFYKK